ncbi:MAG: hypothetical protein JSV34_02100 [Candidatus Omnitrophota bacterium]|nr:MAG: hypothetical protein JSV34_02100 [Candidatus Omnitrophota bacterium]
MKKVSALIIFFVMIFYLGIGFCGESSFSDFLPDNEFGEYMLAGIRKNVSLELEEANLVDVLKMFSQYSGLNFVSTEAVRDRTLTLYMEEVPLREAMDIIFKANNLTYEYYPEAKIFIVKEMGKPTIELKTKVYKLKYARVSGSQFESEVDSISGGSSSPAIKEAVERILSEYGKVTEDPVTNSLIVTDVPVQLPMIDKVVQELDIPQEKVLIEVEMVDVNKTVIDELGITFGGSEAGLQMSFDVFPSSSYRFDSPPSPWREGTFSLTYDPLFKAILYDTSTKILARPKILTLSGETAEIGIVSDTVVGTTSEKAEETGVTISINPERAETGVSLRVTPLVNRGTDQITIVLQPTVKETATSGFTDENSNTFFNIEETTTKSTVRLKDGETLLIGGLIKTKNTLTKEGMPFFSKIPILGAVFRGRNKDDRERELLVFLTPHIIRDSVLAKKYDIPYREQKDSIKKKSLESTLEKISK